MARNRQGKCYLTKRIKRNIEINERVRITGKRIKPKVKQKYGYVNPNLIKKLKTRELRAARKAKHQMQRKGEE